MSVGFYMAGCCAAHKLHCCRALHKARALILLLPLHSGAIISGGGGGAMASGQISAEGVIRQLRAIGKQKVCRPLHLT